MSEGRDELMARVLAAVGRPEIPAGMEARVLTRLRETDAARDRGGWGWPVLASVVVAVAVVAGGVSWIGRPVPRRGETARVATAQPGLEVRRAAVVEGASTGSTGRTGAAGWNGSAARRGVRLTAGAGRVGAVAGSPVTEEAAVAAGFPAPPLPLTRQERLLLRMLRGGETGELVATLSARAERAVEMNESTQRREFFWRPVPLNEVPADAAAVTPTEESSSKRTEAPPSATGVIDSTQEKQQ